MRHPRVRLDDERQPLLLEQRLVQRAHLLEHLADGEPRRDDRELVRRAARVGEDLADLVEQLASAADDAAHALELSRRQIAENPVAQNLGVRDHRGERRAQIVRDVREELRLELVARAQLGDFAASPPRSRDSKRGESRLGARRCGHWRSDVCVRFQPGSCVDCTSRNRGLPTRCRPRSIDSSSCCRLKSDQ